MERDGEWAPGAPCRASRLSYPAPPSCLPLTCSRTLAAQRAFRLHHGTVLRPGAVAAAQLRPFLHTPYPTPHALPQGYTGALNWKTTTGDDSVVQPKVRQRRAGDEMLQPACTAPAHACQRALATASVSCWTPMVVWGSSSSCLKLCGVPDPLQRNMRHCCAENPLLHTSNLWWQRYAASERHQGLEARLCDAWPDPPWQVQATMDHLSAG